MVGSLPAGTKLAFAAFHRRFLRRRRADLLAATGRPAGSRSPAPPVPLHGASWTSSERYHRIPHRAGAAGTRRDASTWCRVMALSPGNPAAAPCCRRLARHAVAAFADASVARIEDHRLARRARLLSPVYSRRTLIPGH